MAAEAQIYAIGTCAIVTINNAGRPGLNRLYTKYEILNTNYMQNKPNLLNAQMNVSKVLTKNYENKPRLPAPAKQTQYEPNLSRRSLWRSRIKPNFTPIASTPTSTFCWGRSYGENYVL